MIKLFNNFGFLKDDILSPLSKQSSDQLHSSELRYRRLFETAQDGILILDAETGKIADANPFLKEILGYSQQELVGKQLWEIGVFKDIVASQEAFSELQRNGYIRYKDLPLQTKDGRQIDVEFVSNSYLVADQKVIQCNIRDISDRKKAEDAVMARTKDLERLSLEQEKTRRAMLNVMEDLEAAKSVIEIEKVKDEAMLASIGEGLIAVDNDKKIIILNKSAENILGWESKDVVGRDIDIFKLEDEEGRPLPITQKPQDPALKRGKATENTHFFVKKDQTKIPLAINVTPIIQDEKIIGTIDIFRDISEEMEIDRAKNEFVSLASHQLRTPLGISKWYIEALFGEGYLEKAPAVAKDYLNEVYKSNERLLVLVRSLLSISRIDQGKVRDEPKLVNVVSLIKEVIKRMSVVAEKNDITLHLNVKNASIPLIRIDTLRLQEMLENLIANAIEYSYRQGKVDITLDREKDKLSITVRDRGIGISEKDQTKLFSRFFRAEKAVQKNTEGSGLGLYVVKAYIEGWGGEISVDSKEKKGASFKVILPLKIKKDQRQVTREQRSLRKRNSDEH